MCIPTDPINNKSDNGLVLNRQLAITITNVGPFFIEGWTKWMPLCMWQIQLNILYGKSFILIEMSQILRYLWAYRSEETAQSWCQDIPCCGHTKGGDMRVWLGPFRKSVYHTDVNISCHAKIVMKCVERKYIFSYLKYHGYNMTYEICYY